MVECGTRDCGAAASKSSLPWRVEVNKPSGVRVALGLITLVLYSLASGVSNAHDITPTIYDDGMACPGGCDAHVVMHRDHNGTHHAFLPSSSAAQPKKCINGEPCRICFSDDPSSCVTATYRGSGPPKGKFDFTPQFYAEHCGKKGIPALLTGQCEALDQAIRTHGYDQRLNCFDRPEDSRCLATMARAREAFYEDRQQWEECQRLGEAAFNRLQPDDSTRRIHGCGYSKQRRGGPNSRGVRWRVLLPGACRPGTLVGRDGLDCCSADLRFAASVHPECAKYFPRP